METPAIRSLESLTDEELAGLFTIAFDYCPSHIVVLKTNLHLTIQDDCFSLMLWHSGVIEAMPLKPHDSFLPPIEIWKLLAILAQMDVRFGEALTAAAL